MKEAGCDTASSLYPGFSLEKEYSADATLPVAGVDEAGRGALAGPMAVGLVIFDPAWYASPPSSLAHIRDSKKLTPSAREQQAQIIQEQALWCDVEFCAVDEIDRLNINGATEAAIQRLVVRAAVKPGLVLLDGTFRFRSVVPLLPVKGGDGLSLSIAAASIIAKVARDREMVRLHEVYPEYGFFQHKGYGTEGHRSIIHRNGPCPLHRRSYEPVRSILNWSRESFHES